ncbi:MAG TPA: MFS transporter [Bryobacteraceae bacterium]|nr:MFS transporter [Bryobacteraceae bacterium]
MVSDIGVSPAQSPSEDSTRPSTSWTMWIPAFAMMASSLLSYIDRQTLAVLSPTILRDTHLSDSAYANAMAAFSVLYMIGNPIFGSFLDFVGLRKGMFLAVSLRAIASTAHAWMTGFWGFAIARGVLGFGEGSAFPAALKAAAESLPPNRQSRGTAIGYSGASLGAIITPLIVTPIALRFGWRSAFLVTGFFGLCWIVMWAIIGRPPYLAEHRRSRMTIAWPNFLERRLWIVVASFGLGAVALGVVSYMSPLYISRAFGLSQATLGKVIWIPLVGWEAGYFFWGWIADKFVTRGKRPTGLFVLLSILALPSALVTAIHSWPVALALFFWATFIADGFVVLSLRVGSHLYPRDQTAMVGGIGSGSWSAVLAVLLPVWGHWFDLKLYWAVFVSMSLLPTLGTLLWYWLSRPDALWREAAARTD